MHTGYYLLFAAVMLMALYQWISVRLSALAQPLRFEMADLCEELLADVAVSQNEKGLACFIVDKAFSRTFAWRMATLFPFVVAARSQYDRDAEKQFEALPVEIRSKIGRLMRLGTIATLATSPLALIIFATEMFVSAIVVAPTGRLVKRTIRHLMVDAAHGGHPATR